MSQESAKEILMDSGEFDKPREKCGVVGIYSSETDAAFKTYDALYELQHRGEQAAGISVLSPEKPISTTKDSGKINKVFDRGNLDGLQEGIIGVGHVRYQTVESGKQQAGQDLQPIYNETHEFVLAHNGNLTHVEGRPFNANGKSDTQSLVEVISSILDGQAARDLPSAVAAALKRVEGAYSLIIADEHSLVAVRDPNGFRPLSFGRLDDGSYAVASESIALDALEVDSYRSVNPGEMLIIDGSGAASYRYGPESARETFCMMEYVYFSRPDTMYGPESVYTKRVESGRRLALEAPADVDMVIGVPGTGLDAAKGYAEQLGLPYSDKGIHKTGYERSFIAATDSERRAIAKRKFNVTRDVVDGKRVAVIDDSLIRGTVTSVIVEKLRRFGASEVHFRVASPPYRYGCRYGIDTGREDELLAKAKTETEIMRIIGVDSLRYLSLAGLRESLGANGENLCDACVTGNYPTPVHIGSLAVKN